MHYIKLISFLSSLTLLVAGLMILAGALNEIISLWHVFNLFIEGLDESTSSFKITPILRFFMLLLGIGVTLLSLVGCLKISTNYCQVMVNSNMLASVALIIVATANSIMMDVRNVDAGLEPLRKSMAKYSTIETVKAGWDHIQSLVRVHLD